MAASRKRGPRSAKPCRSISRSSSSNERGAASLLMRCNRLAHRQDAAGRFDVQILDQAALERGDTLTSRNCLIEGGDGSLGARNFPGTGREDFVTRLNLRGMNERLAIEAQLPRLKALGFEAGRIVDIVEHAVQDRFSGAPGRKDRSREREQERRPTGDILGMQLVGQIVQTYNQNGQPLR